MSAWMIILIVIAVILVIAVLLFLCFLHIKKKIKNTIIDKGAEVITAAADNVLDEKAAGQVNEAANLTAEVIKNGKMGLIKTVIKKGLKEAREKKGEGN